MDLWKDFEESAASWGQDSSAKPRASSGAGEVLKALVTGTRGRDTMASMVIVRANPGREAVQEALEGKKRVYFRPEVSTSTATMWQLVPRERWPLYRYFQMQGTSEEVDAVRAFLERVKPYFAALSLLPAPRAASGYSPPNLRIYRFRGYLLPLFNQGDALESFLRFLILLPLTLAETRNYRDYFPLFQELLQEEIPRLRPAYEAYFTLGEVTQDFPLNLPLMGCLTGQEVSFMSFLQAEDYFLLRDRSSFTLQVATMQKVLTGSRSKTAKSDEEVLKFYLAHFNRFLLPWYYAPFQAYVHSLPQESLEELALLMPPYSRWIDAHPQEEGFLEALKRHLAKPPAPLPAFREAGLFAMQEHVKKEVEASKSSLIASFYERKVETYSPTCRVGDGIPLAFWSNLFPHPLLASQAQEVLLPILGEEKTVDLYSDLDSQGINLTGREWHRLLEILPSVGPQPLEWLLPLVREDAHG